MAAISSPKAKMTIRVFFDTKTDRALCAYASKEVIDLLFYALEVNIDNLVQRSARHGFSNLYKSMKQIQTWQGWRRIVPPSRIDDDADDDAAAAWEQSKTPKLDNDDEQSSRLPKLYVCINRCGLLVTQQIHSPCPRCSTNMSYELEYISSNKGVISSSSSSSSPSSSNNNIDSVEKFAYIVSDDLVIESLPSTKFFFKDCDVPCSSVQEKAYEFGMNEALMILFASQQCKNVLTSVFMMDTGADHIFVAFPQDHV